MRTARRGRRSVLLRSRGPLSHFSKARPCLARPSAVPVLSHGPSVRHPACAPPASAVLGGACRQKSGPQVIHRAIRRRTVVVHKPSTRQPSRASLPFRPGSLCRNGAAVLFPTQSAGRRRSLGAAASPVRRHGSPSPACIAALSPMMSTGQRQDILWFRTATRALAVLSILGLRQDDHILRRQSGD